MNKRLKIMYVIATIVIINLLGIANATANTINNPAPSEGLSGLQVVGAFILMMVIMLLPLAKKSNRLIVKK